MTEIINSLPMWAKVVSIFILITFGAGGFSSFLTNFISRNKIQAEANVDNAEAAVKISTAEKTTTELSKGVIDEYKQLLENEKLSREKIEERMSALEKKMEDFQNTASQTIKGLKDNLYKTEKRLAVSEREVSLLKTYISIVKLRWASITDQPFPEYESITIKEKIDE